MVHFRVIAIDFCHGFIDSIKGIAFIRRLRQEELKEVKVEPPEPRERTVLQIRREKEGIFRRPPSPPEKKDSFLKKLGMIYLMNAGFLLLWQACIYFLGFFFGWFNRADHGYTLGYMLSVPVFLASRAVQALWFSDIAGACMRALNLPPPRQKLSFSSSFSQSMISLTHSVAFLGQTILSAYLPIPIITPLIFHAHTALLNSMYCFDYFFDGYNLKFRHRRAIFETHWPYFLGFGAPLALACSMCTQWFMSGIVFALLFPLFIISSYPANWNRKYEEQIPEIAFCRISYMITQLVAECVRYNTPVAYQTPRQHSNTAAAAAR